MDDERLDAALRELFVARSTVTASPSLRVRLHDVPTVAPRGSGPLGRVLERLRGAVTVAATVAVAAILLLAVLTRSVPAITGEPPVGGPSAGPSIPQVPFVTSRGGVFSAAAVADADRRLAAVFTRSGIEARLIVQDEPSADRLSTPPGWPDRYDTDRVGDLDITVIYGRTPDGQVTCCLTITGALIDRARDSGYWPVAALPDRLVPDLESPDAGFRDVALDMFVRGIESLKSGIGEVRGLVARDALVVQIAIVAVLGGLAGVLVVKRRTPTIVREADGIAVASAEAAAIPPTIPVASATVVEPGAAAAERSGIPWPRDRWLVVALGVALAGLLGLGVVDLLRAGSPVVPLVVDAAAVGLASPRLPVLPGALIALAMVATLGLVGRRGRWSRVALLGLVVGAGLVGWVAVAGARPAADPDQRRWVAGLGHASIERFGPGEWSSAVTFHLQPGEPFAFTTVVRNPGMLPITVLGLDGVQSTEPNPYVARIVGVGWGVQPTRGRVDTLSGRPADASGAWPVTLAPGEELAITVLGRGGPCADPDGIAAGLPINWVRLTYRVAGIERTEPVGLPATILIGSRSPCTVAIPGGTVTYER